MLDWIKKIKIRNGETTFIGALLYNLIIFLTIKL